MLVTYDEVSGIFDNSSYWDGGREKYWFRYAWSLLEKSKMTEYQSTQERCQVCLYALTLGYVFQKFCSIVFEGTHSVDLPEYDDEDIPDFQIGQIAKQRYSDYEFDEVQDALAFLVSDLQHDVFRSLGKYTNAFEVFLWMYCVGVTPNETDDGTGTTTESGTIADVVVTSVEEYRQYIDRLPEDFVEAIGDSYELMPGFNYIQDIMW